MTVRVSAKAIAESPKALLVVVGGEETWVPKSQIDDESEVYAKGHDGVLIVSDWFAAKVDWDE